jgi:hypothetical protein
MDIIILLIAHAIFAVVILILAEQEIMAGRDLAHAPTLLVSDSKTYVTRRNVR